MSKCDFNKVALHTLTKMMSVMVVWCLMCFELELSLKRDFLRFLRELTSLTLMGKFSAFTRNCYTYMNLLNEFQDFPHCFGVSIVNYEQINAGWERFSLYCHWNEEVNFFFEKFNVFNYVLCILSPGSLERFTEVERPNSRISMRHLRGKSLKKYLLCTTF